MATETSDQSGSSDANIYKDLQSYPWSTDNEFQGGLSAILGNASSPEQIRELTLRAQCFYLSRKRKININFDEYKAYLATHPSTPSSTDVPATTTVLSDPTSSPNTSHPHHENDLPPASTTDDQKTAPYPQSFAEIVALITAGGTIPGIRDIPDTVLTDQGTKPVARKRRKPWEKDVDEEAIQGGGTFGDHRDIIIQQEYPTDV
ncbi:hypothetical protein SS1G_02069 [Sclerotinia sclerotiorum 1980 UF-70]|uniref:Uncharacterized protein n=2 Tax=Sclerotinia sclerotiorum (strain ATCC 18683 / 1980 / Ss-1) TaxID=665079 RepID=A7E9T9_SCLS1|nr:hypothetical protein SS1G_02069 [Sclerotinia sclerotiorum 1980 UF-70]APA05614.1 hypothetical protein sscle_01g003840 [Sclerotinia sclerotiorum 1980 UF-70]EDN97141.1 hypothetical protein SS1G_02069 [Sclerotinia sclerotiorum 1980 UF-70]